MMVRRGESFEHEGQKWLCVDSLFWTTENGMKVDVEIAVKHDGVTHPFGVRERLESAVFVTVGDIRMKRG